MTVNERTRHELYEAARQALGDEQAETLMEMLPPTGWADVATKQDLEQLRTEMNKGFEVLQAQMATKAGLQREVNKLIFWLIPFFMTYGLALVTIK